MKRKVHLLRTKAVEKLRQLTKSIDFAMFITNLGKGPSYAVPMSTKRVDDDGNIWFLSVRDSSQNKYIELDGRAHLIYSKPSSMEFLSVRGAATVHSDRDTLAQLYGVTDGIWFSGLDDPNLTAIKMVPTDVSYWDTSGSKLVALIKMGVAIAIGTEPDISEFGAAGVN
jgi:general stress protein 26